MVFLKRFETGVASGGVRCVKARELSLLETVPKTTRIPDAGRGCLPPGGL